MRLTSGKNLPTHSARAGWLILQGMGLLSLVVLLTGLFIKPEQTLTILWNIVVPILPVSFLIAPGLWRAVCPLATLNMIGGNTRRPPFPSRRMPMAEVTGIALLVILVPARKLVFNENGLILAIVIITVGLAALILGLLFRSKSGFCNSFCPVLPVERLYGQRPLIQVANPRCKPCGLCTPDECLDRDAYHSYLERTKGSNQTNGWLTTPHGIFAAAFPGFVMGYFSQPNRPLTEFAETYLMVYAWALVSLLLTHGIVRLFRLSAAFALVLLAAVAIGIYYWFAMPPLTAALGMTIMPVWILRVGMLVFIACWFLKSATEKDTA